MKNIMTVGVSGDAGSFSEEAALLYAERLGFKLTLEYLTDMEGVLAAVEAGKIDIGIFPVINLRGGLVKPAFAAMGKHLFVTIDELWLDVRQCLLALPGTSAAQIKKIASHQQALAQCAEYLKNQFTQAELIEWIDTAKAAKDLAEGKLSELTAVIAPERAAAIYNLEILARNIQDEQPNLTAFIIVKQRRLMN